nr:homeobox protein Hox-A3-like [Aegilops tauschii subsp. strangulata]
MSSCLSLDAGSPSASAVRAAPARHPPPAPASGSPSAPPRLSGRPPSAGRVSFEPSPSSTLPPPSAALDVVAGYPSPTTVTNVASASSVGLLSVEPSCKPENFAWRDRRRRQREREAAS